MVLTVLGALLVACSGPPQPAPSPDPQSSTASPAERSQDVLDALIDADEPGCSAAVGVNGRVVWHGVRGVANLTSGAPITPHTVFDIASVSKQFTATAVLLLAEAEKLRLDDHVSEHVDGLPTWSATVTLEQLMHHSSGIPDYLRLLAEQGHPESKLTTRKQALATLTGARLDFRPGSDWQYSNSNYLLLAEVVRAVSGRPLAQFARRAIFEPLALDMVMDPRAPSSDKALSYRTKPSYDGFTVAHAPYEQVGDAGVQTTPAQLVRWADNYRTHRVGGVGVARAVLAGAVDTRQGDGVRYGAGIVQRPDGSLVHGGSLGGFLTTFWVSKDRSTSAAITCNRDQMDTEGMLDTISAVWSPR